MTKITSLTTDQISLMYSVRDEWINNLTTLKLDKDKVRKGLDFLYSESGLKSPSLIIYVNSPLDMQYAYHIMSNLKLKDPIENLIRDSVSGSVRGSVENSVKNPIWYSVWDSIQDSKRDSVIDSVQDSIKNPVWSYVWNSIYNSVRNSVSNSVRNSLTNSVSYSVINPIRNSVYDSVWDSVENSINDSIHDSVRNSIRISILDSISESIRDSVIDSVMDSVQNLNQKLHYQSMSNRGSIGDWYWVAFYDYFQRIDVELTPKFSTFRDFCCLSGAYDYLLYKDCAIVCGMPSNIEWQTINGIRVASSTTGPAIEWADGFKVYQIRNVIVPEKVVMAPHTITINEIQNESDLEVRRIMIEQYGTESYLKDIKASIVDFDIHGVNNGARILLQDSNNDKWLLVTDGSTDRLYTMAVDSDSDSCSEAHSSLCGFNENLIKLEG